MRPIVAIVKIIGVTITTLAFYSLYLGGLPFRKLFNRSPTPWLNYILRGWGKATASVLSIQIDVEGPKPDPPFFLVSNHLSYVDIIVLFSTLNTTFVAKSEVKSWPVLGWIAQSIGIVFIDRKRKMDIARVNREISGKVSEERGLTLFPEGTTSPGEKILPFRTPLLEYPASSELGVSCCALHYSLESEEKSAHEIVCWWGDAPLHSHLYRLATEKNIRATIVFGDNRYHDTDRKILAGNLHRCVTNLFTPICKPGQTEFQPIQF